VPKCSANPNITFPSFTTWVRWCKKSCVKKCFSYSWYSRIWL